MTPFERAVLTEVARIRRSLSDLDENSFEFKIYASGRIHDGDVSVIFSVENIYDTHCTVKANSVDAAVDEWKRRKGWIKQNTGLLLSPPSAIEQTLQRSPDDDWEARQNPSTGETGRARGVMPNVDEKIPF